jgi:hypothetical protein
MQLITPDLVDEARGLSATLSAAGCGAGLLLLLTGWRAHRFWIVLAMTVTAGIVGLLEADTLRVLPLLGGILFAVAAGVLALSLVRVVAFVAGGATAVLVLQHLWATSLAAPVVWFLAGGLLGLLLFRVWTMVLTSAAGGVLTVYSVLCLADRLGRMDSVALAENRTAFLNCACGGLALVGLGLQVLLERRKNKKEREREEKEYQQSERALQKLYEERRWWNVGRMFYRKAG